VWAASQDFFEFKQTPSWSAFNAPVFIMPSFNAPSQSLSNESHTSEELKLLEPPGIVEHNEDKPSIEHCIIPPVHAPMPQEVPILNPSSVSESQSLSRESQISAEGVPATTLHSVPVLSALQT